MRILIVGLLFGALQAFADPLATAALAVATPIYVTGGGSISSEDQHGAYLIWFENLSLSGPGLSVDIYMDGPGLHLYDPAPTVGFSTNNYGSTTASYAGQNYEGAGIAFGSGGVETMNLGLWNDGEAGIDLQVEADVTVTVTDVDGWTDTSVTFSAPEPVTMALVLLGLAVLPLVGVRRRGD